MNSDHFAFLIFLLPSFLLLGGCYLYEKFEEKRDAKRRWQRTQDAIREREIQMRVRKYNTMHAMRRVARQRNLRQFAEDHHSHEGR
ncbi:hypothetical protein [Streptomyces sp. SM11]|uniref:hypothetical protein n=1 Tax=Streptomyces sp. SM11 TaxID=565557 RepID=UPI000CD57DDB|nr:hypothetical protein [Streptomyces sp. SM11]